MRRNKTLMAGLLCGCVCVFCLLVYVNSIEAEAEAERKELLTQYGGNQVEVYVAKRDISPGEALSETNVEKRLWVSELLPKQAITDLESIESKELTSALFEGEVVSLKHMGERTTPVLSVPDGLCAVSVSSEPVLAVGGSITPGQIVDVYTASGTDTDLLASQVEVLGTSTSVDSSRNGDDLAWITLAVQPEQVKEIIMATQTSKLYFALPSSEGQLITEEEA